MIDLCLEFMAKIVVFDSGLGSLSIIKTIQKICKSDIIYFADQQNFPYGNKSQAQLNSIIKKSIKTLQAQFSPDVLVMASNTPSLILNLSTSKVIGVKPPLNEARKISKSKRIGILGTKSAIKSKGLTNYIKGEKISELAKHKATLIFYLSIHLISNLVKEAIAGGYKKQHQ